MKRDLGEAFGTRKAKSAIKSYDRGQIDISAVSQYKKQLNAIIDESAAQMDTPQQIEEAGNHARPIPKFDGKTQIVSEIYKLHDMFSEDEVNAVKVEIFGTTAGND